MKFNPRQLSQVEAALIAICCAHPLHLRPQLTVDKFASMRSILSSLWGEQLIDTNVLSLQCVAEVAAIVRGVVRLAQYFCDPVGDLSVAKKGGKAAALATLWGENNSVTGVTPGVSELLQRTGNMCKSLGLFRSNLVIAKAQDLCESPAGVASKLGESGSTRNSFGEFFAHVRAEAQATQHLLEAVATRGACVQDESPSESKVGDNNYNICNHALSLGSFDILARWSALSDSGVLLCALIADTKDTAASTADQSAALSYLDEESNSESKVDASTKASRSARAKDLSLNTDSPVAGSMELMQCIVSTRVVTGALLLLLSLRRRDHQLMYAAVEGYTSLGQIASIHSPRHRKRTLKKSNQPPPLPPYHPETHAPLKNKQPALQRSLSLSPHILMLPLYF